MTTPVAEISRSGYAIILNDVSYFDEVWRSPSAALASDLNQRAPELAAIQGDSAGDGRGYFVECSLSGSGALGIKPRVEVPTWFQTILAKTTLEIGIAPPLPFPSNPPPNSDYPFTTLHPLFPPPVQTICGPHIFTTALQPRQSR